MLLCFTHTPMWEPNCCKANANNTQGLMWTNCICPVCLFVVCRVTPWQQRGIPQTWSKCYTSWCSLSPGACRSGSPSLQVWGAIYMKYIYRNMHSCFNTVLDLWPLFLILTSVPAGFALVWQVTLHTFGLVQSKLFPVYFYCLLGSHFVSLAVYAVYHPRELLDWHESVQVKHHTNIYSNCNCSCC